MSSLPIPRRQTVKTNRDGLYFRVKDAYIPTRDGSELCADIFLPLTTENGAKVPALLCMSPYGKDVHASEWAFPQTDIYAKMHAKLETLGPDAAFETLDPLVWTHQYGYGLVRIDCRGIGGSPGILDPWGFQRTIDLNQDAEGNDLYDAIEWTATQSWCNSNVGMSGISYLAMTAWQAAQHHPPSLKAIVAWEGASDIFYSTFRPGGIPSTNFLQHWWKNCVVPYQHGRAEGVPERELEANRVDFLKCLEWEFRRQGAFAILDKFRQLEHIKVPFYSAANFIDTEVHSPGNILAYMWAASDVKYLETHSGDHIHAFYGKNGLARQKQFLDHFLKGDSNSLQGLPNVDLLVRKGQHTFRRAEEDFPPSDTQYREYFLTADGTLQSERTTSEENGIIAEYEGLHGSTFFATKPLEEDFELLGFPYLVLEVSTTAKDMDIFFTMTNVAPDSTLVELEGNHGEPSVCVTRGYMRLSHRELDSQRSTDHLAILNHREPAPVEPGKRYSIKFPIHPTSMVFEKGHKVRIELGGQDSQTLLGVMRHDGGDRTEERFGGKNTFWEGSKLVLPFVQRP